MPLHTQYDDQIQTYDGSQLVSHWAYGRFGLLGDAAVAFRGPCRVEGEALVDLADAREGLFIRSDDMLHFIVEHFDGDLFRLVLRQRLLVSILGETLNERLGRHALRRTGDDLFDGERKLSVSIATVSAVSGLIHTGVNVSSRNTPVPAVGLDDYGLEPAEVAHQVLETYARELDMADRARCKVRAVP